MNSAVVQLTDPHAMGGWFAPFTNRQYCAWFYWLMVVSALALVVHVFLALFKSSPRAANCSPSPTPGFGPCSS